MKKSKKTGGITPTESANKNESTSNKKPVTQKQEVAKKAKGNLPKTGVKMSSVWMIIGILILASAIYGMYRKYITK